MLCVLVMLKNCKRITIPEAKWNAIYNQAMDLYYLADKITPEFDPLLEAIRDLEDHINSIKYTEESK